MLSDFIEERPQQFIFFGDFNAHHTLWGCERIEVRGRLIEQLWILGGTVFSMMEHKHTYPGVLKLQ